MRNLFKKIRCRALLLMVFLCTLFSMSAFGQNGFAVSGTVVDGSGILLPGASIIETGTTNGVVSDFDGKFSINVSSRDAALLISYIGYEPITVNIDGRSTISIALTENAATLDEVVVVGYGSQKR